MHGLTRNPFNSKYTAGGSSTGSAVGLAAGYAPIALGSDTEGSMRGPSEYAGVAGLRPTLGRYSDAGVVPCNIARDTAGVMASTVADVAALDAIVMGAAISEYKAATLGEVKVAVPKDWMALAEKSPGTTKALELAIEAFLGGGATVKKEVPDFKPLLAPPAGTSPEDSVYEKLSFRSEGLDAYIASHPNIGRTTDEVVGKSFYPNVARFFNAPILPTGAPMTNMKEKKGTDEYKELKEKYDKEVAAMAEAFAKYMDDAGVDVILSPCTTGPPSPALTSAEYSDPTTFGPLIVGSIGKYAPIFGLNGVAIPSITIPTAARHENPELGGGPMPAGILLWGKPKEDKKLIEVAMALEKALAAGAKPPEGSLTKDPSKPTIG